ncbi:30S ribosomal protein S8 [Candidatus Gottesmanbacteria bacterium RIFCSPLOWO2_01_FULL_49_10]|uniref:Small ribosomal subunit protein uS8 n=1 Tax=Candidatus Gottesmanbacteria bacterium RIFCSPLOWO2_01_FULL_49_10 TaxID=1798396 RepID=A0A1F6AYG1_9BACT|nr:MAG: 30S ribosomal protein S8 [Microgenomates group bacterium GW2011_GWA2_47_8]OGG29357.1 MAG: 30S ribosomal protein S8 [Candidatus Gottesmanbacteria bacterium RIFCSPLOWO2_01_FULL_49_10]
MVTDPIGDMLIQIKNAYLARKKTVILPHSKMKEYLAKILKAEGYLSDIHVNGEDPKHDLELHLVYNNSEPALTDLKRKSKPGLRVYVGAGSIPMVVGGMGVAILSTSKGIMTGREAKKLKIGGELLCEVW